MIFLGHPGHPQRQENLESLWDGEAAWGPSMASATSKSVHGYFRRTFIEINLAYHDFSIYFRNFPIILLLIMLFFELTRKLLRWSCEEINGRPPKRLPPPLANRNDRNRQDKPDAATDVRDAPKDDVPGAAATKKTQGKDSKELIRCDVCQKAVKGMDALKMHKVSSTRCAARRGEDSRTPCPKCGKMISANEWPMEQHFDNGCPVTAKEWQAEQKELEQKAGKAVLKSCSRSPLRRKSAPVPEPPWRSALPSTSQVFGRLLSHLCVSRTHPKPNLWSPKYATCSQNWFKGKSAGKPHQRWVNLWFPVCFPLIRGENCHGHPDHDFIPTG